VWFYGRLRLSTLAVIFEVVAVLMPQIVPERTWHVGSDDVMLLNYGSTVSPLPPKSQKRKRQKNRRSLAVLDYFYCKLN
jgi:hypothetical protein